VVQCGSQRVIVHAIPVANDGTAYRHGQLRVAQRLDEARNEALLARSVETAEAIARLFEVIRLRDGAARGLAGDGGCVGGVSNWILNNID
jgi:hypothetical protein